MFTSRSPYDRYTPAQQELRAIAFSISSEKVPGARFVDGWHPHDPRPTGFATDRPAYIPVDLAADLDAAAEREKDPDAGWISVPSQRVLKRRERAANRRKARDATSSWLGRSEEPGTSLVETYALRADWVLRKDGSHELVIR